MNQTRKVAIIGSTQYQGTKILLYKIELEAQGYEVRIPIFDDDVPQLDELEICKYNLHMMKWADEVHLIWDGRSLGTWGDFCMAFALKKIVKNIFIEPKSIKGVIERYAEECSKENMSSMS